MVDRVHDRTCPKQYIRSFINTSKLEPWTISRGGGVSDVLYTHRLGRFWGFKILNFNIFVCFLENMNIFWGGDFCGYFWGHF